MLPTREERPRNQPRPFDVFPLETLHLVAKKGRSLLNNENHLMKFICPLLAALATIVALFGPWFTRTTQITERTLDATLMEVIQGTSFVEYTSQQGLWISGLGVLLVLASAVVGDHLRKRLAQAGSVMMLVLPGWSLINVYVGDEDLNAGWAMWVTVAITVAIIILARMMPQPEPAEDISPQVG